VGDSVLAKYPSFAGREDNPWFSAKITAGNSDGTFDLRFSDGDTAKEVLAENLYVAPNGAPDDVGKGDHRFNELEKVLASYDAPFDICRGATPKTVVPKEGDSVLAKFPAFATREDNPWFCAKITAENSDGTFGIRFSDGDTAVVSAGWLKVAPDGAPDDVGKGDHRSNDLEKVLASYGEARFSVYQAVGKPGSKVVGEIQHPSTLAEFNAIKEKNPRILIDFTATWCGPCQVFL